MSVSFTYGDYEFKPAPLFSIQSEPLKTPDGTGYGILHNISLEGNILLTGAEISSGIIGVFQEIEAFKDALDHDGKPLIVSCNDSGILSGYPVINNYSIQNASDNYTLRATYNVDLTMPTTVLGTGSDVFNSSVIPPYIESVSENWDVELQDERLPFTWTTDGGTTEKFGYVAAVTHTVDVTARIAYTGDRISNTPWEDAMAYATGRLGFDGRFVDMDNILPLPGDGFTTTGVFNNYRQISTNKTEGTISVTETFIVTPSGTNSLPNNCIETFDIDVSRSDGIDTVSIQGEIRGLADVTYTGTNGLEVESSKYSAASGYFNLIKPRLFDRAKTAHLTTSGTCFRNLNPQTRARTIGINLIDGIITYNYQYDTVTSGCITGDCLISQQITIDDQLAADVFAQQIILGRAAGPILQDIGTITARTRSVNIELTTLPPESCGTVDELYAPVPTGAVQDFIDVISGDLISNYSQVFVSSDAQNWNFTNGKYTKSIAFTYNNCTT